MGKFCGYCGAELPDDALKCPSCGADLGAGQGNTSDKVKDKAIDIFNRIKTDKKLLSIVIGAIALVIVLIIVLCCAFGGGYKKAINNYLDVTIYGKYDKIEKLAPASYWKYYEDEYDMDVDDVIDNYEDVYENVIEYLEDDYGKDIKVDYKITDEDELSEKKLKRISDNLKDEYNIPKKSVTKGYKIDLEITIKGDDDEDTDETTLYAVKIDGDWYLCDEYGDFVFNT